MPTVLDTLKELHSLHSELADVQDQLKRTPLQLKSREADVTKKEAALAAARDELKKLKMATDSKELSLKSSEAKVRDYKVKLNACKTNKEFSALQDEIKNFETQNGVLEEEVLVLMTEQETKNAAIKESIALLDESKSELAKFKEVVEYKLEKLQGRVTLLQTKITEFEAQLDPGTLSEYRRLVKTRGSAALAACVNGICEACFTGQTAQSLNELMMGRVVFCKSCGAMLYIK
jgi:predicted  nucleic acid-binding Zn-ribbon protein